MSFFNDLWARFQKIIPLMEDPADPTKGVNLKSGANGGLLTEPAPGSTALATQTTAAAILAKLIAAPATEALQTALNALAGTVRHTTTPSKANAAVGPVEVDDRGNAYGSLSASHIRPIACATAGTATYGSGTLSEGACDALSCRTAAALAFAILREGLPFLDSDTANWTLGNGWALDVGTRIARHTPGAGTDTALVIPSVATTTNLIQAVLLGLPYAYKFNVADRTAGTVTDKLGTAGATARSADGNYLNCLVPTVTTALSFTADVDFDGAIDFDQIMFAGSVLLQNAGTPVMAQAVRVLGLSLVSAPATLVLSPATHVLEGHWYRRADAVEVV